MRRSHLVNPSSQSFGVAVITRAGSMCLPPRPETAGAIIHGQLGRSRSPEASGS
jgi:hypothetical protein